MFTAQWFRQHQRPLLWLLNHPVAKHFTRHIMCIPNHDLPKSTPIHRIMPNGFFHSPDYKKRQLSFDFRTHNKYAKRVYHAGKGLWLLAHWFDMKIANPFQPAWNLGFDAWPSEPYYPDASSGGTTVDGRVLSYHATYATARTGSSLGANVTAAHDVFCRGDYDGSLYRITRSAFTFNLAALSGGTVLSTVYSIYYYDKADAGGGASDLCIVNVTLANNNNVVTTDWGGWGTTQWATTFPLSSYTTGQYNSITYNATGVTAVGTAAGSVFAMGIRSASDLANSAPGNAICWADGYFADQTGVTKDPKLEGTYTPAAGGIMF